MVQILDMGGRKWPRLRRVCGGGPEKSIRTLGFEDLQKLPGAYYGDSLVVSEPSEFGIAGYQVLGPGRDGSGKGEVVLPMGGDTTKKRLNVVLSCGEHRMAVGKSVVGAPSESSFIWTVLL